MKYLPIDNDLFIKNRAKFMAEMKPNSIAVFTSNDIYPIGADSTMPFEQNRDLFYLSGVDQEDSLLILFPDAYFEKHKEMLFVTETNEHIAVWEGEKLTKEAATETSGIKNVHWRDDFEKLLFTVMPEADTIYINTNEHYRAGNILTETQQDRMNKWLLKEFPAHQVAKANPILQRCRSVKEQQEIDLIQTACDITNKGFRRVLGFVKPGVMEYEIEAEYMHEFLRNRSSGFAYTPIVASGNNANVLHYVENNQECKAGELILMDVGSRYANYSSDMSRTIPVSGTYTDRQKAVYNAVLWVKKEATKLLVPGNNWHDFHKEVGKMMTSKLIELGLISQSDVDNENPDWPAYKKYFMHGTSHHMGLDTHDYGLLNEPFKAGMVLTVEPGIYIPDEGFGIRIEDDVMIQENGEPLNLMADIPIEVEEIEELMNA